MQMQENSAPSKDAVENEPKYAKKQQIQKRHHYRLWFGLIVVGISFAFWNVMMWVGSFISWNDPNDEGVPSYEGYIRYTYWIWSGFAILCIAVLFLLILLAVAVKKGGENKARMTLKDGNNDAMKEEEIVCSICGSTRPENAKFCPNCGAIN